MKLLNIIANNQKKYGASFPRTVLITANKMYCKMIRHMISNEYDLFQFYRLNRFAQKCYVTGHEILTKINDQNNDKDLRMVMDNKILFNKTFSRFLGRDYLEVNETTSFASFETFFQKHGIVFIKPVFTYGGCGVKKNDGPLDSASLKRLYDEVLSEPHIIEEAIDQTDVLAQLFPLSINTLRVVTMIDKEGMIHIPFANIRIGRGDKCVDNFSRGGITASIDVQRGIVISRGFDKFGNCYTAHPDTGVLIVGMQIPAWDRVKQMVLEAAAMFPKIRYVGWDVVVRKDGSVSLIEGNSTAEARLHQVTRQKGLRDVYTKYLDL